MTSSAAARHLRDLLKRPQTILRTPCCHDALSARLIQQQGFEASFMSGFAVAATKGLPDAGLISFDESKNAAMSIIDAVSRPNELYSENNYFPIIVDGDTGYGNEMNVRRTVSTFARIGTAAIMIEDQVQPKRCGHARGKTVIPFDAAVSRIKAACDARDELGDIVIIARTDARAEHGLDEALKRARAFRSAGADITFVEAPRSIQELETIGKDAESGPYRMVNLLLHGQTPALPANQLQEMGFKLAAYPFDLMVSSIAAMTDALKNLDKEERRLYSKDQVDQLWEVAGFNRYYARERKYM